MQLQPLIGKLVQLRGGSPALWWPFLQGWRRRNQADELPCLLPHARKVALLSRLAFYTSYQFFSESSQGRDELGFFLRHLRKGDVLYDIGGFYGAIGVAAKLMLGEAVQVHIFEPLPANCKVIDDVLRRNNLEDVQLVRMAMGNGASVVGGVITGPGVLELSRKGATTGDSFPAVTLDEYVAQASRPPTVLKIDVDGFEMQVLQGGKNYLTTKRPRIWIEVHPEFLRAQGQSHDEVLSFLREAGYRLEFYKDRQSVHADKSYHVWCE